MKILMKVMTIMITSLLILSACGNNSNQSITQNNKDKKKSAKHVVKKTNSNNKDKSSKGNSNNKNIIRDQLKLGIGDTANIKTNISHFLLTVSSISLTKKPINGHASQLDGFLLAKVSLKNVGKSSINAGDAISTLELTDVLGETGNSDEAVQLGLPNVVKGELNPGQTLTGKAVFEVYDAKKYYLISDPGDVAANLCNNIKFTFKTSQAQ